MTSSRKFGRPVLSKLVQDYIREYIVGHGLSSGDALPPEGQIAEDLGISRNSVHEAVRALEALGVLEVRHGNGIFVRSLNFDAVLNILSYNLLFEPSTLLALLHIRKLLECGIMPEVVRRISAEDLEECRHVLDKWESNLADGTSMFNEERSFHQKLYRVAENPLLTDFLDIFWNAYRNAEAKVLSAGRPGPSIFRHHKRILQAVEAKDANLAQSLMSEHFGELEERLKHYAEVRTNSQDSAEELS